jgi:hypothetical protein
VRSPGQLRPVHQLGQAGAVDTGREDDHRLVENADTAHTVSHKPKHTSQNLGCPDGGSHSERTLAEKVWDDHVVRLAEGEPDLLYIDLHLCTR